MSRIAVSRTINASPDRVWEVFTSIAGAADMISGIDQVDILNDVVPFGVGFRWRETRRMFGQNATEEMWVTKAIRPKYYEVEAASHGSQYLSRYDFAEVPGGTEVRLSFQGTPESLLAKAMDLTMGWAFRGSAAKALRKDLDELAAVCETG